ncbi:MAG: hypothetical protein PHV34_11230 [Verrucomicrobiae bacterium]|nr:hypothetical protein [Verrucomicrobiae bacterium]
MSIPLHVLYFRSRTPECPKYVRALEPLGYMVKRGHRITDMESLVQPDGTLAWEAVEGALAQCNVLLVTNVDVTPPIMDLFMRMVEYCRQHRKLMVFDTDDCYPEVPDTNPLREHTLPWEFLQKVVLQCHAVTVTGTVLQKVMSLYHRHVFVLPNMIDFSKYPMRPRSHERLRVGWMGGATHLADLPIVAEAVRNLRRKYIFDFVLGGFPHHFSQVAKLVRLHGLLPEDLKRRLEQDAVALIHHLHDISCEVGIAVPYEQFPAALAAMDLDIGLCPIRDTLFNRCRSAIKFYQYAAVGTVAVASNIYPYSDEPVLLAENTVGDWEKALEPLLLDKAAREKTACAQRDYVLRNRNYELNGMMWELLYQRLLEVLQKA